MLRTSPSRSLALASLAVAVALRPTPAYSSVQAPVSIRLAMQPAPPLPGQAVEDTAVVTPARAGILTNFSLQGAGWSVQVFNAPQQVQLPAGQVLRVPFRVTAQDPLVPLTFSVLLDGVEASTAFDFSPWAYRWSLGPQQAHPLPAGQQFEFAPLAPKMPPPDPLIEPRILSDDEQAALRERRNAPTAHSEKSRAIRVHGRFMFTRSDGLVIGADGATVRIYDEDTGPDELLLTGITDVNGFFDVTFTWDPCGLCDGQPDLYVQFAAGNSRVTVRTNSIVLIGDPTYRWDTGIQADYTGTDWNVGIQVPSDPTDTPAVSILNDEVRAWRWLASRGYDAPRVEVDWPDGDGTTAFTREGDPDEIHFGKGRNWDEASHCHEFGHHFINKLGFRQDPDYCNGFCDVDKCGHCLWCNETDHDAWQEGFPDWLADVITRSLQGSYGVKPQVFRDLEALQTCSQDAVYHSPLTTEGFAGALLRDVEDPGQDVHGLYTSGADSLALGELPILQVAYLDWPSTPMDFVLKFRARFPTQKRALWMTAKNCGYEIDTVPPGVVTALDSPSHTLFGSWADPTIDFTWNRASDDCSGIGGYSINIGASPVAPDLTAEIGDVQAYSTGSLPGGDWYFTIRAVDRAGNWGLGYATLGPFHLRAPEPANLTLFQPLGWGAIVVPRTAADATFGSVPAPLTLDGGVVDTWYNYCGYNAGEAATSASFQARLLVDGVTADAQTWSPVAAFTLIPATNMPPVSVNGGRHTFGVRMDAGEVIAETNESDNERAHQWIWSPAALTPGTAVTGSDLAWQWAGQGAIVDGSAIHANCDGYRFTTAADWTAVALTSSSPAVDFDLSLHAPSTGAQNGFASPLTLAARGTGALDAVIIDANSLGMGVSWDAGVRNYTGKSATYTIQQINSGTLAYGAVLPVSFAGGEMLRLWEVYVDGGHVGPVSAQVAVSTAGTGPFHILWLDRLFTYGTLDTYAAAAVTDLGTGVGRVDAVAPAANYYCVVVYRNPVDVAGKLPPLPASMSVQVMTTPPDPAAYDPPNWYAAMVPRPAPDGTANSVPPPASLIGDVGATFLNFAVTNASPSSSPVFLASARLDGSALLTLNYVPMAAGVVVTTNWPNPVAVPAGRHVLALSVDPSDQVAELTEANNVDGQQWAWQPLTALALGTPVVRSAPPAWTAGWSEVTSGEPFYPDCDGVRTPGFAANAPNPGDGYWGAVAVMPGASSNDVDAHLFEVGQNAKDAFAAPLAASGWGVGASDYVLADFNTTPFRAFDVGVLDFTGGAPYTIEAVSSKYLGAALGTFGPYTLGAQHVLQLYDLYLDGGVYEIRLENLAGTVDWGLTLHEALPYQGKSTAVQDGSAWAQAAGQNEALTLGISQPGRYALAVWKAGASDLALSGSYRLVVHTGATQVPSGAATSRATALVAVHPNPFNPSTNIAFDLARAGEARLLVYSATGRVVRTLWVGELAAGRHELHWDGRDAWGLGVASGVYFVELSANGARDRRKLVLVK